MSEPPAIAVGGLRKRYGTTLAVDRVTLDVPHGAVFALVGRNGAGKTTLIRMLLGLTPIAEGSATVLGRDSAKDHVCVRREVGYVPENHHYYGWMTVAEVLRFVSAFYPSWDVALCRDLVARLGLEPDSRLRTLSRGMVAKVALVQTLAHKPRVLILDEPTSGLDAVVRREFLESIVEVAVEEGRTVLFSSHLLTDVERVADRVAVLSAGRLRLVEELPRLKTRMRQFRVTFPHDPPDNCGIPGVVSLKRDGRQWLLVVDTAVPGAEAELHACLDGAVIEPLPMNLEDIFVALEGAAP
ncbi:MAG: hypothetical protein A3K19_27345 [Lentisphaerae bacterium RIFOXYB12_FULL_65_16]|nr:MAG: hypothetical protein A3K18_15930 [Lentisphaerae bacterium RIFOXYA12_64_32]OGV86406.1 MAG: hypothetical protein A3K19_27345 [Lentisphaerae bacterium RIFOXYB12_FULL_65_16]